MCLCDWKCPGPDVTTAVIDPAPDNEGKKRRHIRKDAHSTGEKKLK